MRELCIEEIAMSTRVALPMFLGCRMSELRRHLVPSPTPMTQDLSSSSSSPPSSPEAAQVRRNLFGPIDHDENLKFVQNELNKIAQADCKKWNFDFEAEKPQDGGRFQWEPVVEGGVPQAYEMPRLSCLSNRGTTTTTTTPHSGTPVTTTTQSASKSASPPITSIPSIPSSPSVPECSTTTTTTTTAPPNKTSIKATATSSSSTSTPDQPTFTHTSSKPNLPSCSKDTKPSSGFVMVKQCNNNTSDLTLVDPKDRRETQHHNTKSLPAVKNNRTRSSQTQLTDFMKIRKSKRAATTKIDDDQIPSLVKRSKTTTS